MLPPALLLELLHSVLLIIQNGRCKWHRARHAHMCEGDDKRSACFFRARQMADDAALITGVRQIPDDVVHPIGIGNILGLNDGASSTSNGAAAFSAASSRVVFSGLSSIPSSIFNVRIRHPTISDDSEYGSTEPYSLSVVPPPAFLPLLVAPIQWR